MEAMHGFTGGLSLDDALAWEHARDDDEDDVPRPGWWELIAVVTLVVGGTGLPIIGWLVGIGLVALSDVWSERDKTVAILVPAVAVAATIIAAAAFGPGGAPILEIGPLAVAVLLSGPIAGWLGGIWLTARLFAYA
jgi:hypothetical protein